MSAAGERRYRRERRIRSVRSGLHLACGFGLLAIVGFVLRGPWYGIAITLAVIVALQGIRLALRSLLPPDSGSGIAKVTDVGP